MISKAKRSKCLTKNYLYRKRQKQAYLQKTVFQRVKDGLLQCKRAPFSEQKAAF